MTHLATVYISARAIATETQLDTVARCAIGQAINYLHALGKNAHPDLLVDIIQFSTHLGRCGAVVGPAIHSHVGDIYLVCACIGGDLRAIERLRELCQPVLSAFLRRVDVSLTNLPEIEQALWEVALVGSASAPPKLLSYKGVGAVTGWLAVVALRIAITLHRRRVAEGRAHDILRRDATTTTTFRDPELMILKERFREGFGHALQQALDELDDRARLLFRLNLVNGLSIERIAVSYGVSQSTVSRWMADCRRKVISRARQLFGEHANISDEEFDSLGRLLASQIDLTLL
jgi:RNA polymerase sigma-70 factor (ECF subfamily)